MIREGKTFQIASLMQAGQALGMQTMDMALERLLLRRQDHRRGGAREGERQGVVQAQVRRGRLAPAAT